MAETEQRCADPLCGHQLAEHGHPDGQGCTGAVDVKFDSGPDPVDEAERCHCPTYRP